MACPCVVWNRGLALTKAKNCKFQMLLGVLRSLPHLFNRFPVFQDCTGKKLINLCKAQTRLLSTFDSLFVYVAF